MAIIHPPKLIEGDVPKDCDKEKEYINEWKRALIGIFFFVCFMVFIHFFGYLKAVPIFVFLMVKFAFKEKWKTTISVSLGTWFSVWIIFDLLLSFQG
jgi:hypothetical protein